MASSIDYTLPLDQLPDPLPIEPLSKPFDVTITPPGSKSITNRAYVLAALVDGESKIIRPLRSDDTDMLLEALCTLGAEARWEGEDVYIKGVNGRFPKGGEVNLGHGGTPTRFMIACACLAAKTVVVDGSPRMRERPIAEGVDMLRQLGANIEYVEEEGRLPVRVIPSDNFKGGEIEIGKTQSSQFISALVLIAPVIKRGISLSIKHPITSESYIDLTIGLLRWWGIDYSYATINEYDGSAISTIDIQRQTINPLEYVVESDASGATYWTMSSAIGPKGSVIHLNGVDEYSPQPDIMFASIILPEFGANVTFDDMTMLVSPGSGKVHDEKFNMFWIPDAAVTLGAASALANKSVVITGLHTLRVKETDRLAALENELTRVGCKVETTEDSITIHPIPRDENGKLSATDPVVIETYDDHRMAMAFAVLGLVREGISISNPAVVSKSYPGFWSDFAKLYG